MLKLFVLFGVMVAGSRLSRADELQRWHHAWQGTAKVESPHGTFHAAIEYEDFDPAHSPAIGYRALLRIYLTPFETLAEPLTQSDTQAALKVWTTKDGHSVFEWPGWRVDALACNEERRVSNKWLAGQHPMEATVRVVTKQVRDTILIVLIAKD
jgi:hypothetical protein